MLKTTPAMPGPNAAPQSLRGLKITVLAGGPSAEREVSLASGRAVAAALRALQCDVETADISPGDLSALDRPVDAVFIALHGTFGEDGQLQRILERRGITYCGSDAAASALAMNKVASKRRFVEAGVPTPPFDLARRNRAGDICAKARFPLVLKPVAEGSSVDCHLIRDPDSLRPALDQLLETYNECLVERYIDGPELTVSILDETALPVCEIRTPRDFYDYQAKYLDDTTEYLFDRIPLPSSCLANVQRLSLAAHRALGCRHFSRVDWKIDAATNEPYCLEVNTIPGFTDHSLLPKAAARAGISFERLCARIVELALSRGRDDRS
jgi:D-alanine-D-alanine ligase